MMCVNTITTEQFDALIAAIERKDAIAAAEMSDDAAALRVMFGAYERLKKLGWRDAIYCPKDGTIFEVIEAGSTGIHLCHYEGEWPKGTWWVHGNDDLWPSRPILFRQVQKRQNGGESAPPPREATSFQDRVQPWMMACFGAEISADRIERNHRFLEEAIELVQSLGCTADEARQLVDYVFGLPIGDPKQEVGGVMVTLAALCLANGFDMHTAGETELSRVWTKVEQIRAKQAAKPKCSPLPGPSLLAAADQT